MVLEISMKKYFRFIISFLIVSNFFASSESSDIRQNNILYNQKIICQFLAPVSALNNDDDDSAIRKMYGSLFDETGEIQIQGSTLEEKILSVLLGSKKIRLGTLPDTEKLNYLKNMIKYYTDRNLPINILTMWGATKGYGLFNLFSSADAFDVLGLKRFHGLQQKISEFYSPGIHVTIVFEDITEYLLTGMDETILRKKIKSYYQSLVQLLRIFNMKHFLTIKSESDFVAERGMTNNDLISRVQKNSDLMYAYWSRLKSDNYVQNFSSPEFRAVQKEGWQGPIPREQWEHYIERSRTEHPDWSLERRAECACNYLGMALTRFSTRLLQLELNGEVIKPIKASFVPYPPGTSEQLKFGRLEYKVKDSRTSNNTTPPWAGFSIWNVNTNGYSLIGIRELRELLERGEKPNDAPPFDFGIPSDKDQKKAA